jgi:UDP-N-acetyl-D-glucosamine dehydrogenase
MKGSMIRDRFRKRLEEGTLVIGIIGLGYVGLPLAVSFAGKFRVIGYDTSREKIDLLSRGISPILDVGSSEVAGVPGGNLHCTSDSSRLGECDAIIICVPTPLSPEKEPDLSYVRSACSTVASILRPGMFVILESTTYPGTTEEVVVPILERSGLRSGKDFGVAYSPERIDPGSRSFRLEQIPKVVGGIDPDSTWIASEIYRTIIPEIIPVSNPNIAEATKMMENIFRNVNIALVNEMALIFERMGIDVWEVIRAASTKPFGFMPFYPGPGVGGHCIPLDPYYMAYKAKRHGLIPRFIETSGEINTYMRMHVINLVGEALGQVRVPFQRATIAVMGLSYKKNIDDTRESPSLKILEELISLGADIRVYDPLVPVVTVSGREIRSAGSLEDALSGADCAVFIVDHDEFRKRTIASFVHLMKHRAVVDCRNIFEKPEGVIYFGIGKA